MRLGLGYVPWMSLKNLVLIDSKTDVEYVATPEETKEIMWLEKTLEDLQEKQVNSTPLLINNTSTIKLAKNLKLHDQTKHINIKCHLI